MYTYKVWKWENGRKGKEYTQYMVEPFFYEDRLDETLDTAEVILDSMPISEKTAFPPKTKFRIEMYSKENDAAEETLLEKYDMVVEHDDVEEYVNAPDICCHRIHLIEPSVIAQGMHVDNIALTYELQDVTLNYEVVYENGKKVNDLIDKLNGQKRTAQKSEYLNTTRQQGEATFTQTTIGQFVNTFCYEWDDSSTRGEKGIRNLVLSEHAANSRIIEFNIPRLYVYGSKKVEGDNEQSEWDTEAIFELNTITRVNKIVKKNGVIYSTMPVELLDKDTEVHSGALSFSARKDSYGYCDGNDAYLMGVKELNDNTRENNDIRNFSAIYKPFPQVAKANPNYPKLITFKTDVLSAEEILQGYTLQYEIICSPDNAFYNGMIAKSSQSYYFHMEVQRTGINSAVRRCSPPTLEMEPAGEIHLSTSIYCEKKANSRSAQFIMKGIKYSCYELLRKAMLTCDTYVLENGKQSLDEFGKNNVPQKSITYPIVVDERWEGRLKTAKMFETVFEQKNLWEILLQIGYYLHAIPYLSFAEGVDQFVLSYKQLGETKDIKTFDNRKLTIFNSRNLSEYFAQYDSYLCNLFSPQNLVEEWLVVKTSDSNYLVSNDTAELQTKYPITEIVDFYIYYKGEGKKALAYIFEKSIYEILTNEDPSQISPAKGNSIYFTLGSNKIEGLAYVAPSVIVGQKFMSLKYIVRKLFGEIESIKFNDLRFKILYRTQDTIRLTQVRSDLQDFMKNSGFEKYPHHEQFYGQQDKIIDSERFSANLWGRLVKVANNVYQTQEVVESIDDLKNGGDLVEIDNEAYYVTAVDNEFYRNAVLQKVTYSKNFNQISNIVTIPSEPRFYEVSERAKIRREVRIHEFFALSGEDRKDDKTNPRFMNENWKEFIEQLIFKKKRTLPNYAWTRFLGDKLRYHKGANSSYIATEKLFPSCEIIQSGENTIEAVEPSPYSDCIVPLLHFPLHDGIVFEWDMEDNFKVGDFVDKSIHGNEAYEDKSYLALQALRYVDVLGRADFFRFKLFNATSWDDEQIQKLPQAVVDPDDNIIGVQGSEDAVIALDKDNREALSFNYQISLLHKMDNENNDFISFANLFGEKDSDLKVCLINKKQSLFDERVDLIDDIILSYDVPYTFNKTENDSLSIVFGNPLWVDNKANISQVEAIVFYQENENKDRLAYIIKNVKNVLDDKKLNSWFIYPVFNL